MPCMGDVSAVSRGGTILHAPAGCNPPLGSAVTGTPSIPIACRGAATALSGVASVDEAISHTQAPPPILPKTHKVRRLTFYYSVDRKFLQSMLLASITFVSNMDTSH